MKHYILIVFIALALNSNAQAPQIKWQSNAGGTNYEVPFDLAQDAQGNYIMVGYTLSNDIDATSHHGNYYEDYFVVKMDINGNLLWSKCFGGTSQDIAVAVNIIDTTIYVSGYTWSNDGDVNRHIGADDAWLLELDAHGNIITQQAYGGTYSDEVYCMASTNQFHFIGGTTSSSDSDIIKNPAYGYDALLIKTEQNGKLLWAKAIGGKGSEQFRSIFPFGSQILCVGMSDTEDTSFISGFGSMDVLLSDIDNEGNTLWQKRYGGTNWDQANSITQMTDTSFLIVGQSYSSDFGGNKNRGNYDVLLLAVNASGDTIWTKTMGGSHEDVANKVIHTNDDNLLLVGSTNSDDGDIHGHHPGNKDFWLVKLNKSGDTLWTKCIGSDVEDAAFGVVENIYGYATKSDNYDYIVAGYTQSANGDVSKNYGMSDFWLAELLYGTQSIDKINPAQANIYPNPASGIIHFQTNFSGKYTIELSNMKGQILLSKSLLSAQGEISLPALSEGIYWLKFNQGNKQISKKLVLK